jgi:hypothetical protein
MSERSNEAGRVQKVSRADFIAAHPRCCYCNGRQTTAEIDHAPARVCFVKKSGPQGFEFPSCSSCNRAVATSEQVMAFYIRSFDQGGDLGDESEYDKLISGIVNNAPRAIPQFRQQRSTTNALMGIASVAERTMTIPDAANRHIELFALKILYAIYYKTTGRMAGSSNRYLLHWAQAGTEEARKMAVRADAWFDQHVVGKRPNVDLGEQFVYQSGYHPQHGFFGIKMSFGGSFVFFGVIGPARELSTLKPRLPLCPSITDAAKKVRGAKRQR